MNANRFFAALVSALLALPVARLGWNLALPMDAVGPSPQGGLRVEDVPKFSMRARVVSAGGKAAAGRRYVFHLRGATSELDGGTWTAWWKFDRNMAGALFRGSYPVVVYQELARATDPTMIEVQLKVDETSEERTLTLDLFDSVFTILVWRDESGKARVGTMAEYNRRYWKPLEGVTAGSRPRKFPIADRFIGDGVRQTYREGIENLSRAGFSAIMVQPSRSSAELLKKFGLRVAGAVYAPPGYAFDYSPSVTPQSITTWAEQIAKPYLSAGYDPHDVALFAMSDEPGWYYPSTFRGMIDSPVALGRFHEYLKNQGLELADVGAREWSAVRPIGRSAAHDLPSRRLFYWSSRFFAWDSARHFSVCSRELEKAFYPSFPIFTNWNFFAGRFYVPGPVANNPDKSSPDAAMGGHDWTEFGRMRGSTMLWTEDWFADGLAFQWSFYCARLRCAAEKSGIGYGGYVVPRVSGNREGGLLKKMLCVIGSGGKALTCYTFGPEYLFPGNCYSEKPGLLRQEAEANGIIGAAEDLLWPGKRPRAQVAILWPRSSFAWDIKGRVVDTPIQDATNFSLNGSTVDYLCEAYNHYCALQHANIPADFVDEDDLNAAGLKPYRVLYVTEPNIPAEGQKAIAAWLRAGGTLVTVTGAGARDRYDEPCRILADAAGIREEPRERMLISNSATLNQSGRAHGVPGDIAVFGPVGRLTRTVGTSDAHLENGLPAVVRTAVSKGQVIHFTWMPGVTYANALDKPGGMGSDLSRSIRTWIARPTRLARISAPITVDSDLIETPLLLSEKGAAITLLNWRDKPVRRVGMTIQLPFPIREVSSVKRGRLPFQRAAGVIHVSLPLNTADILLLRR